MIDENVWVPSIIPSGGMVEQHVERPGCGHLVTIQCYMRNNAIPASEQESIQSQLALPCPTCQALQEKKK